MRASAAFAVVTSAWVMARSTSPTSRLTVICVAMRRRISRCSPGCCGCCSNAMAPPAALDCRSDLAERVGVTSARNATPHCGEVRPMGSLHAELRQILRRLARTPMLTAIILITLAVGIGANTAIFTVLEGVLLKPLPYPRPDELVGVWHAAPSRNLRELSMT